jgi:hypothetical protein
VKRYYLGVDWADKVHQVWVGDFQGNKVAEMKVAQTPEGMSEFSRWLHERRAQGICRVPPDSEHWISESEMAIDRLGKQPGGRDGQTESVERREALRDCQRSA